ncbi:MAG TPA: hypothetical protein VKT78_11835 [Fimbriimonadaceae bacterium]|nr:hypothetical protein [Fimbriimonadaceae bacterium]
MLRLLVKLRIRKRLQDALTLALLVGMFGSIVVACLPLFFVGIPLMIACICGMFASNKAAENRQAAMLLYARASRIRKVETFKLSELTPEVRQAYAIASMISVDSGSPIWKAEEELMLKLTRFVGRCPTTIETLDKDGVVLTADGNLLPVAIVGSITDIDAQTIDDCPVRVAGQITAAREAQTFEEH